jgi:hypothetical protein
MVSSVAEDPLDRAIGVIGAARERGVPLRLLGGLAVRYLCSSYPPRARDDQDLDLAGVSRSRSDTVSILETEGFVPDKRFNALHGHKQLYFRHEDGVALDVMLDRIDMCHVLDFRERIEAYPYTLPPTDLLLSKLQIVEINEKDLQDAVYLLAAFPIRNDEETGALSPDRLCQVVCGDWGWWRTVDGNLERIITIPPADLGRLTPPGATFDPAEQARSLRRLADEAPKSLKWRIRSKVGDRVRWYELPEEVDH